MFKKKTLRVITVISSVVAIIISLIYIVIASYAMYGGDDFAYAISFGAKDRNFFEYWYDIFKFVINWWFTVQGDYFSSFLMAVFNPIVGFGFMQLRIVSVLNMILVVAGLCCLLRSILKKVDACAGEWIILYAIIIGALTSFRVYKDIYFSYICAVAYSTPLALLCIVFSVIIKKKISTLKLMGVCIGMFLVSGGILEVAGLGCIMILLFLLNDWLINKKWNSKLLILFGVTLAGACFNAMAPGHFIRHNNYVENSSIAVDLFRAIIDSMKAVWNEINWLLVQTPFIVFMLFAILIGMLVNINIKKLKIHTLTYILSGLIPFVTIFPVVFGYASADNLPDRVTFVLDFVLIVLFVLSGFLGGNILTEKKIVHLNGNFIITYLLIMIIAGHAFANGFTLLNNNTWKTFKGLATSEVQDCYYQMVNIFDEIEKSTESDIVIENYPPKLDYIMSNPFSTNKENWINNAAATWYGKSSLHLAEKDE